MNSAEKTHLESKIIKALETCYDPEIPVNIYDLGLVYAVEIGDAARCANQNDIDDAELSSCDIVAR